ncbi:MAG: SWIM zinc finger family protein [Chloroflexi bacterium]|nr:SWIM zinc finger family protein [Chloroflexota bacterium]
MAWSVEQVLGLAPDPSAARAARELARRRLWSAPGRGDEAAWGSITGSSPKPYRTAIDLTGPSFDCSCPSRKVPCKHALGLFLLAVTDATSVPPAEPPSEVREWLDDARGSRTERRVAEVPRARAANAARREERISNGVEELDRWLQDLVRAGLAEAASRPWSAYGQMSARLVDAQAPGLGRLVRHLGGLPHTTVNWPERMLIDIGQLALLLDGWRRLDALPSELRSELRALIGITESREVVLARPAVHDVWDVLGRRVLEGERMLVQRTWLWGRQSRRWALLLDFSVAGQPIYQTVSPGLSFEADLHFFAGALPLRAVVGGQPLHVGSPAGLPGGTIQTLLRAYAAMLGQNPWLERAPVSLNAVVPRCAPDGGWWIGDSGGQLHFDEALGWRLLAVSGGQPIDVFGEWDGFSFMPLSVLSRGELLPLRSLVAA